MSQPTPPTAEQLDRIEQYLQADPQNPQLLVQAIDTALAMGDIAAARKHANNALDALPGDPFMRHRHANVLVAEGRLDEAAVIFGYLWAKHGDPNIAYNLGLVRYRQGNYDAAFKAVTPI
ncbi:MAG TPA: tetratricopeptide repeat protein, partial [Ramlibacter sp.]|nr:tetratricopeptide repeat protein [Ramlibacter sp.]